MSEVSAVPAEDIAYALRAVDRGFPHSMPDVSAEAVAFCAFNGYLDHDAKVTDAGRKFLNTVGVLYREA